jgi:hypothetical protein
MNRYFTSRLNCRTDGKVSINMTGHKILYIYYEDISGYNGVYSLYLDLEKRLAFPCNGLRRF